MSALFFRKPRDLSGFIGPFFLWIDKALKHPANKYVVVQADHVSTPDVSGAEVFAWIKSLP